MSLMLLKTKNLSWQDHSLNIEVMMSPQGHTLLLNKHKALDTKAERQRAIFDRERQSCLKSYVLEERLIKRQRQSLNKRRKELEAAARSKSAGEYHGKPAETRGADDKAAKGRSLSAPSRSKRRSGEDEDDDNDSSSSGSDIFPSPFPKSPFKTAPLFGATTVRNRVMSEVNRSEKGNSAVVELSTQRRKPPMSGVDESNRGVFITEIKTVPVLLSKPTGNTTTTSQAVLQPSTDVVAVQPIALHRRNAIVTFSNHLPQRNDSKNVSGIVSVEIHEKSVEDKVRAFLKEQEAFNQRPSTSGSSGSYRKNPLTSNTRSPNPNSRPLVANKYTRLTVETKVLEKSFDKFCESQSFEDLLKTMKMASKMRAHVRQARNTSLVPTMAVFKSTKTFMTLLKRKQRKEKEQSTQGN